MRTVRTVHWTRVMSCGWVSTMRGGLAPGLRDHAGRKASGTRRKGECVELSGRTRPETPTAAWVAVEAFEATPPMNPLRTLGCGSDSSAVVDGVGTSLFRVATRRGFACALEVSLSSRMIQQELKYSGLSALPTTSVRLDSRVEDELRLGDPDRTSSHRPTLDTGFQVRSHPQPPWSPLLSRRGGPGMVHHRELPMMAVEARADVKLAKTARKSPEQTPSLPPQPDERSGSASDEASNVSSPIPPQDAEVVEEGAGFQISLHPDNENRDITKIRAAYSLARSNIRAGQTTYRKGRPYGAKNAQEDEVQAACDAAAEAMAAMVSAGPRRAFSAQAAQARATMAAKSAGEDAAQGFRKGDGKALHTAHAKLTRAVGALTKAQGQIKMVERLACR